MRRAYFPLVAAIGSLLIDLGVSFAAAATGGANAGLDACYGPGADGSRGMESRSRSTG